ncbi:hypothetical protein TWF481_003982 [Arthrobotrys musiformis]|uniref:Uncharacterized protein n=1 Tax=Arthrobotrys musiformis TaxID=47236 RepID=A0AAV9WK83_9PEZI
MPPKRAASGSSRGAAKRPRPEGSDNSDSSDNEAGQFPVPPRSKRWAKISGSGNLDDNYKLATRNPTKAYKYVCICQAPFSGEDDDDDDDEDDEDEDEDEDEENGGGSSNRQRCDGGDTCLCNKPAEEHPDHPWKITVAGKHKFFNHRS